MWLVLPGVTIKNIIKCYSILNKSTDIKGGRDRGKNMTFEKVCFEY